MSNLQISDRKANSKYAFAAMTYGAARTYTNLTAVMTRRIVSVHSDGNYGTGDRFTKVIVNRKSKITLKISIRARIRAFH